MQLSFLDFPSGAYPTRPDNPSVARRVSSASSRRLVIEVVPRSLQSGRVLVGCQFGL